MTIRRRLLLSNLLMVVILIAAIATNMLLDRSGVYNPANKNMNLFYKTIELIRDSSSNWAMTDHPEQIINDIKHSGFLDKGTALSCAIYRDETRIAAAGDFAETNLYHTARQNPEEQIISIGSTALFTEPVGAYRIYLLNEAYVYGEMEHDDADDLPFLFGYLVVVLIVLIANRLLNRMVFKSIMTPLTTLTDGVYEIREGNLDYRIDYQGNDEFARICTKFNEMATQIQSLMEAKTKDNESRKELIAGISHDLKTPLTAIKAYVEGLQKGVASTIAMREEYLQIIAEKANDLEHTMEQLFLFSKLDVGEFPMSLERIDIGEFLDMYLRHAVIEYQPYGLSVLLHHTTAGVMIQGDPAQLRSVFTNILENSVKYGRKEDGTVEITGTLNGGYVELSFQDNGTGIAGDQPDKIFDIFYRADRSRQNPGKGSGLGLSIARKIIERHGGTITAENSKGSGLKLVIKLPIAAGE